MVFVLLHLSGDPTYILLAPEATAEQRAAFRNQYGLDRPLPVQYARYLARVVQGDFGQSFSFQAPALGVALQRLPATLELTLAAMVIAVAVAIPAAVLAALRRGTLFDRLMMGVTLLGQSVPTFWLGMMMIIVVAVHLRLLPVSGRGGWAHLAMPAVALALWLMALLARVTRSEMLEAARAGLRPHRPGQGHARARDRGAPRAQERAAADRDGARASSSAGCSAAPS